MAKICINGNFEGLGTGPNGSGPMTNNEEVICDILTEIISTLFKMYRKLHENVEKLKYTIEKEKMTQKSGSQYQVSAKKAASQMELNDDDFIPE